MYQASVGCMHKITYSINDVTVVNKFLQKRKISPNKPILRILNFAYYLPVPTYTSHSYDCGVHINLCHNL